VVLWLWGEECLCRVQCQIRYYLNMRQFSHISSSEKWEVTLWSCTKLNMSCTHTFLRTVKGVNTYSGSYFCVLRFWCGFILSKASWILVWRIKRLLLLSSIQKNTGPIQFPKCDTESISLYTKHCSRGKKMKRGNRWHHER